MKKFYSVLAVAAIATGTCFAATPAKLDRTVANAELTAGKTILSENVAKARPAKAHAKATSASLSQICGDYNLEFYSVATDPTTQRVVGWDARSYPVISSDGGNNVTVSGFWVGQDSNGNPRGSVSGSFDSAEGTLSLKPGKIGQVALSSGGMSDVYMYIQDWDNSKVLDKDIVLTFDERMFAWSAETDSEENPTENIIITDTPCKVGDVITRAFDYWIDIEMYQWNSLMNTGSTESPNYIPVYTEKTEKGFMVANLIGSGFYIPFDFTIDKATSSCSAPRVLYGENMTIDQAGHKSDVYISSAEGGNITGIYQVMEPEEEGDLPMTGVVFPTIALYSPTYADFTAANTLSNTVLLLNFDVTAGIEGIVVEDSNAPAVYYNLQGVRVENPRGLVIRVQNGKATKTFVK